MAEGYGNIYKLPERAASNSTTDDTTNPTRTIQSSVWKAPTRRQMVEWAVWAWDNMSNDAIDRNLAPSGGAYEVWKWARENPKDAVPLFVSKLLPSRTEINDSEKFTDDGREVMSALDEVLERLQ